MALASGTRLGPYDIVELLGAGGMGEVYRARDPRLGRDVALKVLPAEAARDAQRLAFFEREARAVAALNHPNILTVFDVGTEEGVPYIVSELLEGENLRELVSRRTPSVRQVLGYALQAARGLEAAHAKGIVHRDLKPENLFLTTDGRVKILDFGLAKLVDRQAAATGALTPSPSTASGRVVGTVAYMSPEQARGQTLDARSDVFSFGVVLYELLARKHPFKRDTAAGTLTAIVEVTPPDLESLSRAIAPAVGGIVRRCLEKAQEERYASGHDVVVALEAVLAAPSEAVSLLEVEERSPYPGLQPFTERDASVFFGREREVEELWRRIRNRKLLAVIGPSGVGKTSFLRAGVLASRPQGWAGIVCTPGTQPFRGLGQGLVRELAGDVEALERILSIEDEAVAIDLFSRWRRGHGEALLVVDQFEELFTLNSPEVQERFATLLGRLVNETDVGILLSLRDDFLIRCCEQPPLAPVLGDLTALLSLGREDLRRAVVGPARKRGYRFDDDSLVEEMVSLVEGVRGALPLLAFAVARLWEKRDRERKLLTREAYQEIAGVEGALAQHAEATMDKIGPGRQGVVREIFRNLVTAHGTRAVIDREELLSAFSDRPAAEEVLRALVDARLLTTYEVEEKGGEPSHHRVEVVHESLLKAWPRLVRWQAQDEEGALLRDQLKQAAHLWEEKGRTSDLLWTGTAYREFELWRERYPGALTALEEDFARSMADKARRKRRLVQAVVASCFVLLAGVATAIGVSRHQAARARDQAQAEALRAEAGKLLALAQTEIDRYPTAALAYARKSLELADTPEARRFAVETLWRGPVARILSPDKIGGGSSAPESANWGRLNFSPDAKWLALEKGDFSRLLLFPRDGRPPRTVPRPADRKPSPLVFGPQGDMLVAGGPGTSLRLSSLPDLREVGRLELGGVGSWGWIAAGRLLTGTRMAKGDRSFLMRSWTLPNGEVRTLGTVDSEGIADASPDPAGPSLAYASGRSVYLRPLGGAEATGRVIGHHTDVVSSVTFFPRGDGVASVDQAGEIRLWSLDPGSLAPLRTLRGPKSPARLLAVDANGTHLARAGIGGAMHLWDLRDPPDAVPVVLKRPELDFTKSGRFDPTGRWLVLTNAFDVAFWPVSGRWKRELPGYSGFTWRLAFTPDGRWLVSCPIGEAARLWPMTPAVGLAHAIGPEACWWVEPDPASTRVLVTTAPKPGAKSGAFLLPIAGGPPVQLRMGWEEESASCAAAFDPRGRRAVTCPCFGKDPRLRVLRVWDLETGEGRTFSLAASADAPRSCESLAFAPDGAILVGGAGGMLRVVLPSDPKGSVATEAVYAAGRVWFTLSPDGRKALVWAGRSPGARTFDDLLLLELATHTSQRITTHGQRLWMAAFDPSGRIVVSADVDGVVRAGPITGEEPHLLLGHSTPVLDVAVSPDGRWIASVSDDGLNLWPMPDVTKPPLHTLPHAELLAKLDAFTNLRVIRDPTSSTGWKLDVGPFPGWKDVPTW